MDSELQTILANIKGRSYPGSSVASSTLYHDLPFIEFKEIRSHRKNTLDRWNLIKAKSEIDWAGKTIIDLGCNVGGVSLLAARSGSIVTGYDYDKNSLALARYAALKLGLDKVIFTEVQIDSNFIMNLGKVHVYLWLSQWMWMVKKYGIDVGKDMLFEMSKKGGVLIFESASSDAMAAIKGTTQKTIKEWLWECTGFTSITDIGFVPGWNNRHIFVCKKPVFKWSGYTATVERVGRNRLRKTYKQPFRWMAKREAECLRRLAKYDNFPKLLWEAGNYIDISYCGIRKKVNDKKQCMNILKALEEQKIIVRDINPKNLLNLNGTIFLIDMGWATLDFEKDTPVPAPSILGGRWYEKNNKTNDKRAMEMCLNEK